MELASNSGKRNRYLDARKRNGRINVEERGIRKGSLGAVSFLRDDSVINFLLAEREREREPFPPVVLLCSFLLHAVCTHYVSTTLCWQRRRESESERMGFAEEWKIFNVLLFGRHRWPLLILFHFGSFLPELFHLAELNSWQVEWKVSSACSLRNGWGGISLLPQGEGNESFLRSFQYLW